MAAEPVRAGRATVYVTGDSDAIAFAKRNASWAHIIAPEHPFDKRPNTWIKQVGGGVLFQADDRSGRRA